MDVILWTAFAALVSLVFFKMYIKLTTGWCKSERRLDGKTVLITGANAGIGKETARDLARRGARVILACKCLERGNNAAKELTELTTNSQIFVKQCDLSSLESVRTFCNEIKATEHKIDILVLNAG